MWAQVTEKLADEWGRGIRYGEEPENPDTEIRFGRLKMRTRREVISALEVASHAAAKAEEAQLLSMKAQWHIDETIRVMSDLKLSDPSRDLLAEELPPEIAQPALDALRKLLDNIPQGRVLDLPQTMTVNEFLLVARGMSRIAEAIVPRPVWDTLQLIAQVTDE